MRRKCGFNLNRDLERNLAATRRHENEKDNALGNELTDADGEALCFHWMKVQLQCLHKFTSKGLCGSSLCLK